MEQAKTPPFLLWCGLKVPSVKKRALPRRRFDGQIGRFRANDKFIAQKQAARPHLRLRLLPQRCPSPPVTNRQTRHRSRRNRESRNRPGIKRTFGLPTARRRLASQGSGASSMPVKAAVGPARRQVQHQPAQAAADIDQLDGPCRQQRRHRIPGPLAGGKIRHLGAESRPVDGQHDEEDGEKQPGRQAQAEAGQQRQGKTQLDRQPPGRQRETQGNGWPRAGPAAGPRRASRAAPRPAAAARPPRNSAGRQASWISRARTAGAASSIVKKGERTGKRAGLAPCPCGKSGR